MKKRIIGSIFILLIVIPMYLIGGYFFKFLSSFIGVIAYKELIFLDKYPKLPIIIGLIALLNMIIFNNQLSYLLLCILLIFILFYKEYDSNKAFKLMGIILLLGISFNSFNTYMEYDKHILLYLVLIISLNNIIAYIIDNNFGKHKFNKILSNKTIEGLIGGIIFGFGIGLTYYLMVINPSISLLYIILLTLILNMAVIVGDIMFSKIKRDNNVKDYGNIIPGYGGVLDILGSLITTSFIYLLITTI